MNKELTAKTETGFVAGTVTGGSAPTSVKMLLGNIFKEENIMPFLAGAALMGVFVLALWTPLMIEQSKVQMRAEFTSHTAKLRTDLDSVKVDAKIGKEDALSALAQLKEIQNARRDR